MKLGELIRSLISLEASLSADVFIEFRNTDIGSVGAVLVTDNGKLILACNGNAVFDKEPAEGGKCE